MANLKFDLYRYQILPRDRFFQGQLFDNRTIDEVLANKNAILAQRFREARDVSTPKVQIIKRLLYDEDQFLLLRLAPNRWLPRETKDFRQEEVDTWPSLLVALWNEPDKQFMAVQERREAFQDTESVVRAISQAINQALTGEGLRVYWEPLFVKDEFWEIIGKYEKRIKDIQFELITPNLSNIRGEVAEWMKQLAKKTNTAKTDLKIMADPEASLTITKDDPEIEGLVTYASEGGGRVSVKITGYRRRFSTSESRRIAEIDEAHITGNTAGDVVAVLKEMLNETLT